MAATESSLAIVSNWASLAGGVAALIGIPMLIWQIRGSEKSRRLDILEARIIDLYLNDGDIWNEPAPPEPIGEENVRRLRREIRLLVSLVWLLGQRTRVAGRPPKGDLLRIIETDVALQLGMREGVLQGWKSASGETQSVLSLLEEIRRARHFKPYDELLAEKEIE